MIRIRPDAVQKLATISPESELADGEATVSRQAGRTPTSTRAPYSGHMTPTKMDEILSLLEPDEAQDALWLVGVLEKWNMRPDEADEWQRRIVGRREFLDLRAVSSVN